MDASSPGHYRGRFAPSPTGPLHAGSLVAALASFVDARAQGGSWLVRIEDIDAPRCVSGADRLIVEQLRRCGLVADEPLVHQSQRASLYGLALDRLIAQGDAYPCACSRQDIAQANALRGQLQQRHGELVYPGTCRPENGGLRGREPRAWRLRVPAGDAGLIRWNDRRLGPQEQHLEREVGDFVLRRADGLWAYQLAVVVDDAAQDISDVVRGQDLADNTARQIHLQRRLGLPTPRYLHTPLVLGTDGEKLSKQNGAQALDLTFPLAALNAAAHVLSLSVAASDVASWLQAAARAWAAAYPPPHPSS